MPRYFFHVHDGQSVIDHEGLMLADFDQARRMAIRLSGSILDDEAQRIALGQDWRMEVTDGEGLILFRLDFLVTDAPAVSGKPAV